MVVDVLTLGALGTCGATYQACFAALAALETDTHLRVHKENNVLFPLVMRLEHDRTAAVVTRT